MKYFNLVTVREKQILKLLAKGYSDSEIAEILVVERTTVKTHLNRLFPKLHVNNRTEAVVKAFELGLISCPCRASKPNGGY